MAALIKANHCSFDRISGDEGRRDLMVEAGNHIFDATYALVPRHVCRLFLAFTILKALHSVVHSTANGDAQANESTKSCF